MRLIVFITLVIVGGFISQGLAADDPLVKYYNKEGTKVLRYLANGIQECNQLSTVMTITETQYRRCEVKSRIASKKSKKAGVNIAAKYFLSQVFLNGFASAINEETKFKRMLLSEPGAMSLSKSREFNKLSNQYLEDFKNGQLR